MEGLTFEKHPAAQWAEAQDFSSTDVDCTTTVVLKILDGKCKMLPGEKVAIMEIYDVIRSGSGVLFDATSHQIIDQARHQFSKEVQQIIHNLRLLAEKHIPKPVMKKYKAMLREGLFGE